MRNMFSSSRLGIIIVSGIILVLIAIPAAFVTISKLNLERKVAELKADGIPVSAEEMEKLYPVTQSGNGVRDYLKKVDSYLGKNAGDMNRISIISEYNIPRNIPDDLIKEVEQLLIKHDILFQDARAASAYEKHHIAQVDQRT